MMAVWPELVSRVDGKVLRVQGVVQPSPIADRYAFRLEYREQGRPRVFVDCPQLTRRIESPEEPIPHTYGYATPGSEQPCVYYPDGREWNPAKPIAVTVIPWLLCWLMDYEIWLATGEWLGGGMAHRPESSA